MLQMIREHAQGVVVWAIVGLIIITFALFGLSSYLSGSSSNYVANVNGVEIGENEFRREFQNYQTRLQKMLGKNFRADMFDPKMIKQQVISGLVARELMTQYLGEQGFKIAPAKLAADIHAIDAFKDESGQFSKARYLELLTRQGLSEPFFEQQMARDVASQFIQTGISQSDFVTDSEVQQFQRLNNQQRDIGYLHISKKKYLKKARPSRQQIETYYESHKNEFMTLEKISVEYIELDLDKMAQGYEVSDEASQQHYDSHRQSYVSQAEQRKVRHILIKVDDKMDEQAALKKISGILRRLKKGESFNKLAGKLSEDPGSAKQGGDLGFFGRGVMDKAFEESVFKLQKGKVSKPVRSAFGYHLIKLDEINAEKIKTFQNVKADIKKELQIQQAEQTFYELSEKLNNITYEQPGSLQPVVDELGLTIQKTALFDLHGGTGIAKKPKVTIAAFSDEVLNLGRNSDMIELSDSHLLVIRKLEHQQASQKSLSEVRKLINDRLRNDVAQEKVNQQVARALLALQQGKLPKKLARTIMGAKWLRPGLINRAEPDDKSKQAKKLDPQVRRKAFTLPRPQANKTSWAKSELANGDGIVVGLYRVKLTDTSKSGHQDQQRAQSNGTIMLSHVLDQLRLQADVKINLPKSDD